MEVGVKLGQEPLDELLVSADRIACQGTLASRRPGLDKFHDLSLCFLLVDFAVQDALGESGQAVLVDAPLVHVVHNVFGLVNHQVWP